jgi:hypothetical protein
MQRHQPDTPPDAAENELWRIAMIKSANRLHQVGGLSVTVLGFVALLASALPAAAAGVGLTESCVVSGTGAQCELPALSSQYDAEIHYVSAACASSSTGAAYNLQQLTIMAIPPNGSSDIAYQTAGNRGSVNGVVNTAEIVDIHVKVKTKPVAVFSLFPAPGGTTKCSVSITYSY